MSTNLGQTASITLLTAVPGSGKSLRMVQFIAEAIERGEVVFACNINGLKLPHIPFENPREWKDIPAGSVLVVDEAQNWFRTRRGGDAPKYITDMETIRHEGIRLILATQQPDYLDTHLRGLVGSHEHLVRVEGKEQSTIFRHHQVMDNVRSSKARSGYDNEVWDFPVKHYNDYDSAQTHTVKYVMSSRKKRGLMIGAGAFAMLVACGFVLWRLWGRDESPTADNVDARHAVRLQADTPVERPGRGNLELSALQKHTPEALDEYYANLKVRAPTLPWSAPIYDGRAAVAEPRIFCVTSGVGLNAMNQQVQGGYTCMTEQGTRVVMQMGEAQLIARWGEAYNPYKAPRQDQQSPSESMQTAPEAAGGAPVGPAAVAGPGVAQHAYGGMRDGL